MEAISEQAELFNLSIMINDNTKNNNNNIHNSNFNFNNPINPYNNTAHFSTDSQQVNSNVNNSNRLINNLPESSLNVNNKSEKEREKKESEYNVFKTLIDISDLIECDSEIELNLRDIENTLLRHLSEMKMWYRYYTIRDGQRDENNASNNNSVIEDKISAKDILNEKKNSLLHSTKDLTSNYNSNNLKEINNANNKENINIQKALSPINSNQFNLEGVYSNDLAFGMELRDLWKFLRESNIITVDFSLAQFDRLFFKGPKNYVEMFMYPEEITTKNKIYDYIYYMIYKSKNDFTSKFREKLFTNNLTNNLFGYNNTTSSTGNFGMERNQFQDLSDYLLYKAEPEKEFDYFNENIHNKKQIILLRHFYEAILRSAYLRYNHMSTPLHYKITNLIDTCIRTNINFKKVSRKSQMHTESSINSSVIVDMKAKSFENNFEFFLANFENRLKNPFKNLYFKSTICVRKDDMTVTYRFFYDNIIKESSILASLFELTKYIELINIYHKDKIIIQENQKISREVYAYIESLLDVEFIFYEFCELIFFITRKLLTKFNLNETKENYSTYIQTIEELIDTIDSNKSKDKYYYSFPKLGHHIDYENIIASQKAREEEEKRKILEKQRVLLERKMMEIEDTNILPEFIEEEDNEDDSSLYSNY